MVALLFFGDKDVPGGLFRIQGDENGDYEDFSELIEEIQRESDRGAAIVSAAVLEGVLEDLLKSSFQRNTHERNSFSSSGPISTFSAKISLSHSLGLISDPEYRDLEKIRRIRNDFAHVRKVSFETERIADRCRSLEFAGSDLSSVSVRSVFMANVLVLLFQLYERPDELRRLSPKLEVKRTVRHFHPSELRNPKSESSDGK
ncbi:MAG TPA: hypothetical protein DCS45_15985 [Roseovarius nubinhibens]|mgnify:CR=1 FL=1|uniref:Mannitol operon repressor n=1 Tax=Roseovarius nubinhibens TaxID=314263 RepID=A0A348WFP3_9RHOB|nr:hypothetical protein [Roseovarius nubinhibens]